MRKFINIVTEASMPFGRLGNLSGFTFGFESELVGRPSYFADEDFDIRDIPEDELADEFNVDDDRFNDGFSAWQEDNPDGDYYDWIEEVGLQEWFDEYYAAPTGYGIQDDRLVRYVGWSRAAEDFAYWIGEEFGVEVISATDDEEPIRGKDYTNWYVESDPSVGGGDDDYSFEVISSVFHDYEEFASTLKAWLAWVNDHPGLYTNSTTGLHINIGSSAPDKIDPLKLLLFSGEKWMTQHWRNAGNGHTDALLPLLSNEGLPATIEGAREIAGKFIKGLNEKSYAVNMLTLLSRGYVEFRPIGNNGYQARADEVFQHISRFVQLIHIASDDQLYRREYAKKLGQLLIGSKPAPQTMDYEHRLIKQWLDGINLYQSERQKIMTDDGKIVITPEFMFILVGATEGRKPIPDVVLRALIRQSGLAKVYAAMCAEFDTNPPWEIRGEQYAAAKQRLDPLIK